MRVLTGLQPSGDLHIGNYFGSIKQMLEAQEVSETFIFIANYHAMTTINDGKELSRLTMQCAIDFLALGIDPSKSVFWVQSDVKEVLELYWILSSFTSMGLLERSHGYKDKVAKGIASNHSLFSYPVLMAADILLFDTNVVPVGKDQIQHVEIARDIAIRFNNKYQDLLTLPEFRVREDIQTIPGLDGQKMSKSYKNVINIFSSQKDLQNAIKKITTQNIALEEPKEWLECNVYNIAKLFLNEQERLELQDRYKSGKEGHGHFKAYLADIIWRYFEPYRQKREYYLANQDEVRDILSSGAKKAQNIAKANMQKIRELTGIYY